METGVRKIEVQVHAEEGIWNYKGERWQDQGPAPISRMIETREKKLVFFGVGGKPQCITITGGR